MRTTLILLISIVLFSCEKEAKFTVTNPMNLDRTDEVLILTKEQLAEKVTLEEGLLPVFKLEKDKILPISRNEKIINLTIHYHLINNL